MSSVCCDLTGCSLSFYNMPNMYSAYSAYYSLMSSSIRSGYPSYLSQRFPGWIASYQQQQHDCHKGRTMNTLFCFCLKSSVLIAFYFCHFDVVFVAFLDIAKIMEIPYCSCFMLYFICNYITVLKFYCK